MKILTITSVTLKLVDFLMTLSLKEEYPYIIARKRAVSNNI